MRERFEQQRIPAAGVSLGNWLRLAAMLRAHNAGHIGFDNSVELAGIKMTPFTMTVIVNRTGVFIERKRFNLPWSGI